MLRAFRFEILNEVRFVNDHAFEAETTEPPDVAVEHFVVDDDDIAEGVDGVTVTMHNSRSATGRPEFYFAFPVGLDDVGYNDKQWIRV